MLASLTRTITALLQHNQGLLGYVILGLSAMVEYIFPVFPGDTVTLFGAFLVTRYGWSLGLSFASVLAGSAVGAMLDFYVGRWMGQRYRQGRFLRSEAIRARVERVLESFRRHGEIYVALNRFLPAIRAVFFLAAGMARLRPARVLFFAMVSAAAWNALIIGVGYAVGANWERLLEVFRTYSVVSWVLVGAVVAGVVAFRIFTKRRQPPEDPVDP